MAKDNRTEKATPQKRQKAREEGNIAKSKDLANVFSLLVLAAIIYFWGKGFALETANSVNILLGQAGAETEPKQFFNIMGALLLQMMIPILILVHGVHIINYLLQVRFLFSAKVIKPKPSRMNPKGYFTRLFSRKSIVDVVKSLLYTALFGYIAYLVLMRNIEGQVGSVGLHWVASLQHTFLNLQAVFIIIFVISVVLGIADFLYQKWEHEEDLKMKKEEVKQEHKDNEGNPEIKQKQKSFMYEIVNGAVGKKMEDATFILNNPTHISVALRYKKHQDVAPVVVAKGEEQLALYIRQLAKEKEIPMVENKPLARSLYYNVDEGQEIPEDLYVAVIEVMKYLMKTKQLEL